MPSENNNSKKNNSGSNGSPQRFQPKVLLVYLVIVAAILTIWFANPGAGSNVKQLTISELVEAIRLAKSPKTVASWNQSHRTAAMAMLLVAR